MNSLKCLVLAIALVALAGCQGYQIVILRTGNSEKQGKWAEKTIVVISLPPLIETHQPDKVMFRTANWRPEQL